jgi:hypothetical protein
MPAQFISNLVSGVAKSSTVIQAARAVVDVEKFVVNTFNDVGQIVSSVRTAGMFPKVGGPPYENILEQFASYTPLWTMACLEPNQFNNPYTYRGIPGALRHVVFSSAGRYDQQRTPIVAGAPEYFVNNFELKLQNGASQKTGNANLITIDFEVREPYSFGLFIQSLQSAAISAGYPSYNDTPYLLKLEFAGYSDDGAIFESSELLTKYFPVKFKNVTFTQTEEGSTYKVEAVPFNHMGFTNVANQINNDLRLEGTTVKDMLSARALSLCSALNKIQKDMVETKQQELADEYLVVFPKNWDDKVGLASGVPLTDTQRASAGTEVNRETVVGSTPTPTGQFGEGPVGNAELGFGASSGGNYSFGFESDVVDPKTGIVNRDNLTIDPKARTFTFPAGSSVQNIIQQVVLSSKYAKDAIDPKNLDDKGMIKWFRVDVQVELGELDSVRGERQKKYIFRVMPFLVHSSVFRAPSAGSVGIDELKKILAKEYKYIYTGQNNDILKFDISINTLFNRGRSPTPPERTESNANKDLNQANEEPSKVVEGQSGNTPGAIASKVGNEPSKPDSNSTKLPIKAGYGAKTVEEIVAIQFQNAILNQGEPNGDLISINLEVLGDPFWIADGGMGNYIGDSYNGDPSDQITSDQTTNYQGTDCYVNLIFRTPVEPGVFENNAVSGLYIFPEGEAENPYSGIYKVVLSTSRFQDGVFRQILECKRMPVQPHDLIGGPSKDQPSSALQVNLDNVEPIKSSPNKDTTTGGAPLNPQDRR